MFTITSCSCLEDEGIVPRRRLLVLINPVSGQGKGESLFIKCAQPLFEMAEIDFTVTVTSVCVCLCVVCVCACMHACVWCVCACMHACALASYPAFIGREKNAWFQPFAHA